MFLHFRTNVRAPSVRARIVRTMEAVLPAGQPPWDTMPWHLRYGYNGGYVINGGTTREQAIEVIADRWSVPLFTMKLPDSGFPWRSFADERNAWIEDEWRQLGLPGDPPPEMAQRQRWERKHVAPCWIQQPRAGSVRDYMALGPLLSLDPIHWNDPARDRYIGHLRVLVRKDFG